ncbi:superoxide dismutase family protein [Zobellia galactanivorans]|uniref:Superoxide dismutase [Cu-Zn] n=1 Tax=Zobellia galactanivorans (strain DSM 12802 / CCUG 47099 / CIP 106680 / NCIMB 13871 / Dsij) TaxID=63186 RepID=G0L8V2_ZOBGA|nr:superoxide dismutase family protein [Zobellia galactanivorans]MBU3027214.1 superoxide dismutase family protein [Zobellia galactanivorans]CAZ94187.1 Superoxide dismutase [Cu-Zn] [Zobellia galactanivorans]
MKNIKFSLAIVVALTILNCKEAKKDTDGSPDSSNKSLETTGGNLAKTKSQTTDTLTVNMSSKSNSTVSGTITFVQSGTEVEMKAIFTGLDEGPHAIHLHENADCSSQDGKSAGGHWNPTEEAHGKWGSEKGYHKGDIGNFTADKEGRATVTFATDEWCIDCNDENKNIIGRSVIVHKGQDDFTSQPSGDAGSRIACAGITK